MSDMSEADKIRNKRLAKLQGQGSASNKEAGTAAQNEGLTSTPGPSSPSAGAISSPEKSDQPNDERGQTSMAAPPAARPQASDLQGASSQPGARGVGGETKIRITRAPAGADSLKRKDGSLPARSPRAESSSKRSLSARSTPEEVLESWEDRTLSAIFRVTLDPKLRHDGHGQELRHLAETRKELEEQDGSVRLQVSILDQALHEAASASKDGRPLDYLLGCWKRVVRAIRALRTTGREDPKSKTLYEARRLCMSYCIFAATLPEMFGLEPYQSNPLAPHLLVDPEDDKGICHEFLSEAVRRFGDDDSIRDALAGAVEEISRQLAEMNMNDNYTPYISALKNIVCYAPLVDALTERPSFLSENVAASAIERETLLGPFFQISPLQGEITSYYFAGPRTKSKEQIVTAQKALRMTLQTHQSDLLDMVNHIVRASKTSRDRMLDWFALTVNANHKRRALQVDEEHVSSDGFMTNVTVCLDQLCDPFMDATFSKIDRIDIEYLRRKPRVDIHDETKINADQHASDEYYSTVVEGTSNFISEIFFLTLAAHHYGTEATAVKLDQLEKDLKQLQKQMQRLEGERPRWINTSQLPMFEAALKKYQDAIDKGLAYKFAIEGVLFDDVSQARTVQFMRYVIVWLLRLVSGHNEYPTRPLELPLPEDQPEVFRCLPEYFVEDVVSLFKFVFRHLPHLVTSTQSDELVTFCITFLRSSEYIKNPYLKCGIVSILFYGIWPTYARQKGVLGDVLNTLSFATQHLLHALINFYIEVEITGAHTQFFDKFNIRYEIFQVIKCIWSNQIYRMRLSQEAKQNLEFFVRFVNLLLNDVTFVLDESLTAFGKIHRLQKELEDGGSGSGSSSSSSSMAANVRTEKEEQLVAAQSMAKGYMQLTNETVSMLKLFTEALADSFTMPEIVQRLADMLDYNVDAMVGPKSRDLKVQNPDQYGFQPRILLSELVDVYLNLGGRSTFVDAVARDGRSYKPANFEKAHAILSKWGLKSSVELAAWSALAEKIRRAKEADDQAEEDLGEIPEEFLDPLMYTLMEDPVILPASKISVDRSTISAHLLSDPHDPFNRVPLKLEDIQPDIVLKNKIEAFKAERQAIKRATLAAGDGDKNDAVDKMDTSTG